MPSGVYIRTEENQKSKKGMNLGNQFAKGSKPNKTAFKKGQIPWNKDTKGIMKAWNKDKKGWTEGTKAGFQKGNQLGAGEKNNFWKGDDVGYYGLHNWVKSKLGRPKFCEHCGKESSLNSYGRNTIQWANINHKYKRNLTDWISLCSTCHYQYDRANGFRRNKI
jgi:hypothetical protein